MVELAKSESMKINAALVRSDLFQVNFAIFSNRIYRQIPLTFNFWRKNVESGNFKSTFSKFTLKNQENIEIEWYSVLSSARNTSKVVRDNFFYLYNTEKKSFHITYTM